MTDRDLERLAEAVADRVVTRVIAAIERRMITAASAGAPGEEHKCQESSYMDHINAEIAGASLSRRAAGQSLAKAIQRAKQHKRQKLDTPSSPEPTTYGPKQRGSKSKRLSSAQKPKPHRQNRRQSGT